MHQHVDGGQLDSNNDWRTPSKMDPNLAKRMCLFGVWRISAIQETYILKQWSDLTSAVLLLSERELKLSHQCSVVRSRMLTTEG